jgi:transcriptional regulator with XRE-family HTH domain
MKNATFAHCLRAVREQAGITQYRLAKLSGVTRQALSRLEAGETQPSWETVQRLVMALELDYHVFVDPDVTLPNHSSSRPRGRPPKAMPAATATKKPGGRPRKEK